MIKYRGEIVPENNPKETPKLWMCVISKKGVILINWYKSILLKTKYLEYKSSNIKNTKIKIVRKFFNSCNGIIATLAYFITY